MKARQYAQFPGAVVALSMAVAWTREVRQRWLAARTRCVSPV